MATTESRSGFRLPWSADRSSSPDASSDPEPDQVMDYLDESAVAADNDPNTPSAATDEQARPSDPGGEPAGEAPATDEAAGQAVAAAAPAPEPAPAPKPARRPTKFLADLMVAMHAAAEQARASTLEQYLNDGKSIVDEIQARSASQADTLRQRSDEDVAGIKDWSKAEIARIREETEARIVGRRGQLEVQLERHAALIEREIEKVRDRLAGFEREMESFFDELLKEEDPSEFAARAEQMPEPPAFEALDEAGLNALIAQPIEAEAAESTASVEEGSAPADSEAVVEATTAEVEAPVEAEATAEPDATAGAEAMIDVEATGEAEATAEAEAGNVEAETAEAETDAAPAADQPFDRDAAMRAIQAAAEAAAALEGAQAQADRAEVAADRAEVAFELIDHETGLPIEGGEAPADHVAAGEDENAPDPRIAMLGLTPDFASAEEEAAIEAAAVDDAANESDSIPEMGEDSLAARLAGLVPSEAAASHNEPGGSVTTQVMVTGLISVASIASFKRHLGRLGGVTHVGVSSGPDGEFIFTAQHAAEVSLRELIPGLPSFQARVTGTGDGTITVSAHDPDA